MLKYQVDIDGSLSGEVNKIVAWGSQLEGDNVFEGAPLDYLPNKYDYVDGEFVIREDWIDPQLSFNDFV